MLLASPLGGYLVDRGSTVGLTVTRRRGVGDDHRPRRREVGSAVADTVPLTGDRRRRDLPGHGAARPRYPARARSSGPDHLRCRGGGGQLRARLGRRSRAGRRVRQPGGGGAGRHRGAARVRRRPVLRLHRRPCARVHPVRGGEHDRVEPAADGTRMAGRRSGQRAGGAPDHWPQSRRTGSRRKQPGGDRLPDDRRGGRLRHPRDRPYPHRPRGGIAGLVRLLPVQAEPRRRRGTRVGRHRRGAGRTSRPGAPHRGVRAVHLRRCR